jgi:hypothetical protein
MTSRGTRQTLSQRPQPAPGAERVGARSQRQPRRDHRERHRCGPPAAPARFFGQAAGAGPAAERARSRLALAPPGAQRRAWPGPHKPAPLLHCDSAWPGWGCGSWAPAGGQRERWPRPQPAQAARGLRLEREDGDGAGWAGGFKLRQGAARSPRKATQEPATRARRPTARAALLSKAPREGGWGARGTHGHGRSRCLPSCPLGGGWGRARRQSVVAARCGAPRGASRGRRAQAAEARRAGARAQRVPQPPAEAGEPPAPRSQPSAAAPAQRRPPYCASVRPGGQTDGGNRERTDRDDDTDTA